MASRTSFRKGRLKALPRAKRIFEAPHERLSSLAKHGPGKIEADHPT
jgi:hypothetical protein